MDSSNKDQLPDGAKQSRPPKDDNDQEAEVVLPISISPRRLSQLAALWTTSVNSLGHVWLAS